MITIYLGSVGSGKTASAVREMLTDRRNITTFSNIAIKGKGYPHIQILSKDMIIKAEAVGQKQNKKTGEVVELTEKRLNVEFWKAQKRPINVVLDEAHSILNARRAMSSTNVIVSDWLALIRRVVGGADGDSGELIMISQIHNRLDPIARDMANLIKYHVCHYVKRCAACGAAWRENSEISKPAKACFRCENPKLTREQHQIQVWEFASMDKYLNWRLMGQNDYSGIYIIQDINRYFQYYDTYQWDNMFSEYGT